MSIWTDLTDKVNVALENEIRVGVTGLSKGGKSTFFTSLINQFQNFSSTEAYVNLPRFTALKDSGIYYGGIVDNTDLSVPKFPYAESIDAICSNPPRWPAPTDSVTEVKIELKCKERRFYIPGENRTVYLSLYDYPGEWLIDILLLNLSYEEFSQKISCMAGELENIADFKPWYQSGLEFKGTEGFSGCEIQLKKTVHLYKEWLASLKAKGFSYVLPGRFIMPGTLENAPIIEFVPWIWRFPSRVEKNSLYAVLKERYESYKENIVRKFYDDFFCKLDRQIILVDCFKALLGGKETYRDLNDTLDILLSNFQYGRSNLFNRLFSPKIDKVIFAATKADMVTIDQHGRLMNILKTMVSQSFRRVKKDLSNCNFMLLSSIKSTRCIETKYHGETIHVLKTDYDEDKRFFPGDLPPDWSEESLKFYQENFHYHNEIKPPKVELGQPLPHMNMDLLLQYLLGDKL